ncbi:MAG TPA: ComF family protein [Cyclobacteriaceae bacterium]|jgi:ComF family protein|nr:ComF family protein [Cyclobacteriaceae bacterium]
MSLLTVKSNGSSSTNALSDFVSLFFPEYCLGCSGGLVKGEEILCTICLTNLPRTDHLDIDENPLKEKFIGRIPLKAAWAFLRFRKTGIVQHLLHELKYNSHPEVGVRLGKLFGSEMKRKDPEFDLIVPLPLHASRQRSRGYNQSAKIAEGLSDSLEVPYSEMVCSRRTNTKSQTTKSRAERWQNVEEAFLINNHEAICDKRILLVDDVITTGATIEACGRQLLRSGCRELSIACIAEAQ